MRRASMRPASSKVSRAAATRKAPPGAPTADGAKSLHAGSSSCGSTLPPGNTRAPEAKSISWWRTTMKTSSPCRPSRKITAVAAGRAAAMLLPGSTIMLAPWRRQAMGTPQEALILGLDVDREASQRPHYGVVEGNRDHEIDEALRAQLGGEGHKSHLQDGEVGRHLACRPEHELGKRLELARSPLRLCDQCPHILVCDAKVAADLDVMRPFVGRTREVAYLQDGKLAQARIEPALVADEFARDLRRPSSHSDCARARGAA